MTNKEIIRALKVVRDTNRIPCRTLIGEVIDLIECQKAEIEKLRKTIIDGDFSSMSALRAKEDWYRQNSEYIARLEAEIEHLKSERDRCEYCSVKTKEET